MTKPMLHRKTQFVRIMTSTIYELADIFFDAPSPKESSAPLKTRRRLTSFSFLNSIEPSQEQMEKAKQIVERMKLISKRSLNDR